MNRPWYRSLNPRIEKLLVFLTALIAALWAMRHFAEVW